MAGIVNAATTRPGGIGSNAGLAENPGTGLPGHDQIAEFDCVANANQINDLFDNFAVAQPF